MSKVSPHFKPASSALLLIDYQVGTMQLIRNQMPDTSLRNAIALAKTALAFSMPIVLTSSQEDHLQGPIAESLQHVVPEQFAARIQRVGVVNAWDDPGFKKAVEATGRRQLIMGAVTMADTSGIPPDDPARKLTVADPDSPGVRHVAVVGDMYSILVSGADTAGRYCLIDMIVPDGGGPPPHRHDFEEMFTLLEGELQFTFRGETKTVRAGSTVNIPANAPHVFRNASGRDVHMLCLCTPAGQEEFFMAIGDPLVSRTSPRPSHDKAQMEERIKKAKALAPQYRTELLIP